MVDSDYQGLNLNQEFQAGPSIYGGVFPEAQLRADCRYLYSKGLRLVRAPLKPVGSLQIEIDWQHTALRIVKEYFPSVSFGSGIPHPHKPEDWDTFFNFVLNDEVPWILAQGIFGPDDVYMLGNEAEGYCSNVPVASISRTSNVVTVVYGQKHMLATGDGIICRFDVLGITDNTFGSERLVTVIDDYTFTFSSTGSDGSFSSPSFSTNFWRFHPRTVYRIVKRLAALVKAVPGFNLKTSYSVLQGVTQDNESNSATRNVYTNVYYIDHAIFVGLGTDLDFYDHNVYSYTSTTYEKGLKYFSAMIDKGYAAFGPDHFRVTEWNLWHDQTQYYTNTQMACKNIDERLKYLKSKTGLKHYFFCYRWQNTEWLQVVKPYNKFEGRVYRDWWWVLINERAPTVEITNNSPVKVIDAREKPAVINWNKIGFNMGQYEQSGTFNATKVSNNLDFLYKAGVRKLRIASGDPAFPAGVTACRNLAIAAKSRTFYVMFVNNAGAATDANWEDKKTDCRSNAAFCVANGIDELCMFNELDYRQTVYGTLTNSVQKQMDFYSELQAEYPTLIISTALAQSSLEYLGAPGGWIQRAAEVNALGLKLTYNVYGDNGDFEQFKQRIIDLQTAYPDLRISEWNINAQWANFPQPESEQTRQIQERFDFLQSRDIENFFFTWNWDHQNDQFALMKANGTFRSWYSVFFSEYPREAAVGRETAVGRELIS